MSKRKKKGNTKQEATQPTEYPAELLERAKKIGVSKEQIESLGTAENLKAHCDKISPATNPDSQPKKGETPKAVVKKPEPELMPVTIALNKDNFSEEKRIVESIVRKLNIKFNNPKLKKITKTVVYDCQKRAIVSGNYEIEV